MNIKHILFPVDFSECSRALNAEVEWIANWFQSDVTLMHVVEIPAVWTGLAEAPWMDTIPIDGLIADAKKRLDDYPFELAAGRVFREVAAGDAVWNIKKWIDEHKVDLVMMGTHGYGPWRQALLGSVAMKLLHDVDCPIWTHSRTQLEEGPSMRITRILCALELTPEAVPLLRFVKDFAQGCGASVRLIHAMTTAEGSSQKYLNKELYDGLRGYIAKEIEQLQHTAGTDFPLTITDGFIAKDVAACAVDRDAELVITGRGKAQERFGTFRTHTYDIIRHAPCPVLSYSAPGAEENSCEVRKNRDAVLA